MLKASILRWEVARRIVARLGKPGHRQAYPSSRVLGAIVRGRQRGHIREKFRAAKRLIIPGPGGRFQKVVMGRFSRRRSAANFLRHPQTLSARRFRSARSLLLREKGARGSSSFCGLQISRARSADAPTGNSTPFAMFRQQSQSGLKGGRHFHRVECRRRGGAKRFSSSQGRN